MYVERTLVVTVCYLFIRCPVANRCKKQTFHSFPATLLERLRSFGVKRSVSVSERSRTARYTGFPLPSLGPLGALSARVRPPCDPVAALFATGRRAARLPPSGRVSPGDRREVGDGRGGDRSRHFVEEMAEFTEDVCRRSGVGRRWCRANRTC